MADQIEDALIREVNDELREEQMHKLWQRYGGYVVGAAILVVAIVAGYQGWKHYITTTRQEEGAQFEAATELARAGDTDAAIAAFATLSADAATGYGVLAQFRAATLKAESGDSAGAAALYAQIAKDNAADPAIGGLANVLGAMVEMNAGGYDPAAMKLRLEALTGAGSPYRHSARELLALVELDSGNADAARALLEQLSADATAPQAMAQRAGELAQSLSAPGAATNE